MLISKHDCRQLGETLNEVLPSSVAIVFICCSATAVVGSKPLLDVSPITLFYTTIHLSQNEMKEGKPLPTGLLVEGSILGDFFD